MLYEPTKYIIQYEISAIVFLTVIMFRYFLARRFPNQKNRLFAAIMWITLADLILDVVGSIIIMNVTMVPVLITYAVNGLFYVMQIVLPILMIMFSLSMMGRLNLPTVVRFFPLLLPGVLTIMLIITSPLTGLFYKVDKVNGYVHGPLFILAYIVVLLYMIATFILIVGNRKQLRNEEHVSVCSFLAIAFVSMVVQYMWPELLISGVAIAIAVVIMYFTIQNPDTMLDATTGAFTYDAMLTFLRDSEREKKRVQLIAVKINNMRRINELVGIENGSLVLAQISRFMQDINSETWVFRMRGGCFVAVTKKSHDIESLSERITERLGQPWSVESADVLVQATICRLATDELAGETVSPEEAVSYIDTAFLQSERTGRKTLNLPSGPELMEQIRRARDVEEALRESLEKDEGFELYYQPIWSVAERRFTSAEALLRLRHPTLGIIPPDEFVPVAENNGLVTAMDELVLHKVCSFIHNNSLLRELGLESIEINLSALEFMQRRLPEQLDSIISRYGVDLSSIIFEITETAATESYELLHECMSDICKKGCRFALDDFGTGYANISQVVQLPFSLVKLDRSLLYGSDTVLGDLITMFNHISLKTVVEGAETKEQVELLNALGSEYIQGFYYARPMTGSDLIAFLKDAYSHTEG